MAATRPNLSWRDRVALRLQAAWTTRGVLARSLLPMAWAYRGALALARWRRSLGGTPPRRMAVPVVVVGNLVAGGAGKTPTVRALVDALQRQGHRPAVVSRGHGRSGETTIEVQTDTPVGEAGDEPLLLRLRCQVPVAVGRQRADAVAWLLERHPDTTVVVCDDGLQHHALARDLQIVVFDERGLGNGWLLPAGPLRAPAPRGTAWPGPVPTRVVYNAHQATTPLAGSCVRSSLAGPVPLRTWWAGESASTDAWAPWRGVEAIAAAGTARPQRFFDMLRAVGIQVVECALPDHHAYTTLPWPAHPALVLVTEKDAIKLQPDRPGSEGVWVVPLDFQLDSHLVAELASLVPAPRHPPLPPHGQPPA